MSGNLYENKTLIKDNVLSQIKAYRNISIKVALLLWIGSFAGHYSYDLLHTEAINIDIPESLFQSFRFSLMFAIIGYSLGSVIGAHLQRSKLDNLAEERARRKRYIENQVAIRQARLEQI